MPRASWKRRGDVERARERYLTEEYFAVKAWYETNLQIADADDLSSRRDGDDLFPRNELGAREGGAGSGGKEQRVPIARDDGCVEQVIEVRMATANCIEVSTMKPAVPNQRIRNPPGSSLGLAAVGRTSAIGRQRGNSASEIIEI